MKSICLIVSVILAVLAATAAESVYEPRIIKGKNAKEGQFTHVVSLRYAVRKGQHGCGASILSGRFLLTAAHCCVYGHNGTEVKTSDVYGVVGALRTSSGGVAIKLDKIIPHKGWKEENMEMDIGLMRTAEEIIFTDHVKPIALPKQNLPEDTNVHAVMAGWGIYEVCSNFFRVYFVKQTSKSLFLLHMCNR